MLIYLFADDGPGEGGTAVPEGEEARDLGHEVVQDASLPSGDIASPFWRRRGLLLTAGVLLVLAWVGDLLLVGFMGIVALLFFLGAGQALRQARVIADTPTSTIRGAAQGRVELNVRVPGDRPLTAPVSGEECSFWQLTVHGESRSGRHTSLRMIGRAWSGDDWLPVADGTGTCLLAMPEATISSRLTVTRRIHGGGLDGLGRYFRPDLRPALHEWGTKVVTEHRFPVDADVHAVGFFQTVPSNRTPFDEDWTDRVLRQGTAAPAWARQLAAATRQAAAEEREELKEQWRDRMRKAEGIPDGAPLGGTVMVHTMRQDLRGNRLFPLLVSDLGEDTVVTRLRWTAAGAMVGGVATLAGAVAALAYTRPALFDALVSLFR